MSQEGNAFLYPGEHENEHYQKRAWCFSLARLCEKYRNTLPAEVIYEFWLTLPIVVSRKGRGSRRA